MVEGYGLCESRVREFHDKGYHLIICLDNGVSQIKSVECAHELSMEVLVIDHHEIPNPCADSDLLFHHRKSGFLDYDCSAASLSYFVASRLLERDDPYFATLAGLAVFSDVMPMVSNNLTFAKLMLEFMKQYRYPNLMFLLGQKNLSYSDISFYLIASLNAVGRIRMDSLSTNNACRFLMERKDVMKIEKRGREILICNEEKKKIVQKTAFRDSLESEHFVSYICDSYSGLSGLFANRILREKNKPTAIFCPSPDSQEEYVCSLRLPEGYHALDVLEKIKPYIQRFGGHDRACGLTIFRKDYYLVSTLLASEFSKQSFDIQEHEDSIPITMDDLTEDNYKVLESFMPFGEGFRQPLFSCSVDKEAFQVSSSGRYAFAYSRDKKGRVAVFQSLDEIGKDASYFVIDGNFEKTEYKGTVFYQISAKKVHPAN